jgi:hypothetical protein
MPKKIEVTPDKFNIELETGEVFSGDPLAATTKLAEAQENTKRWGQQGYAKAAQLEKELEELKAKQTAQPTPTTPEAQNEAQLQTYLLTQTAKALGYENAEQYKADLAKVKATTDEVTNNLVASQFLAQCPDFPNSPEAIEALSKKIDDMKWDFTPQSMIAAHSVCLREDKYKPLSAEEQNATWEQGLRSSNRQAPPPMVHSNAPDANQRGFDPWSKDVKLDDLRAMAIKQQLEATR